MCYHTSKLAGEQQRSPAQPQLTLPVNQSSHDKQKSRHALIDVKLRSLGRVGISRWPEK